MTKKILILIVLIVAYPYLALAEFSFPADRVVTWEGNVGVDGGIPTDYAKHGSTIETADQGDDTSVIQAALTAAGAAAGAGSGKFVLLGEGTFTTTSSLSVPSYVILRGAGMLLTIIDNTSGSTDSVVSVNNLTPTDCTTTTTSAIASGYTKGSTSLTLSDASSFPVGRAIYVSDLNDSSIPVEPLGSDGKEWGGGCYQSGTERNRTQITEITAKDGNVLTISPPLYFALNAGLSPAAFLIRDLTQYAGVENLTIENTGTLGVRVNLQFSGAANSWGKNVKLKTCGQSCVRFFFDVFKVEIRDSFFTECIDRDSSDSCYGVHLYDGSSANLIENNLFYDTANGIVAVATTGNVFGYNYFYKVYRTANYGQWFWNDNWTHGSHTSMNLWEGNDGNGIALDNLKGSSSHETIFRNRWHGWDSTVTYSIYKNHTAIADCDLNNYINVIGNILGTSGFHDSYELKEASVSWFTIPVYSTDCYPQSGSPGAFDSMLRHQNYDYYNTSTKACGDSGEPGCQGGSTDTDLPDSLYLSGKPDFFGSVTWPPFDPVTPTITDIPAKIFYEEGSWPSAVPANAIQGVTIN